MQDAAAGQLGRPLPFQEIDAPPQLEAKLPWWLVGIALLLLALLLSWVFRLMFAKPKVQGPQTPKRPLQTALRKLRDLRSEAHNLPPAESGRRVSEALREYYLHRYGVPAPYRTSEELFPLGQDEHESIRRRHWREQFEPLAARYDAMAYAPQEFNSAHGMDLIETAIKTLEDEVAQARGVSNL
jgi:hypothetical protein